MAVKRSGAGSLNGRVKFQQRGDAVDDYGVPLPGLGPWEDKFTVAARLAPKLGSETVIASRLTGVQPYNLTVRSSTDTRGVTTAWRVIDARNTARIFNIKAIVNPDERNAYLEMLVVEGEPS